MNVTWLTPPPQPEMRRGEISVWFCDFTGISDFGAGHGVLSKAELGRAARFRSEDARSTFVGAHIFLRRVLGAYLRLSAFQIGFTVEDGGKPRLDKSVHLTDLQFNLSHSRQSAICAVARSVAVGIDMERPDPKLCELATAEQVFSTEELRRLQDLEPTERSAAFFRGWTKKEAYSKCKGIGLGADLTSVELGLEPGDTTVQNVWLATFECPGSNIATVAAEAALEKLVFWKLEAEYLTVG